MNNLKKIECVLNVLFTSILLLKKGTEPALDANNSVHTVATDHARRIVQDYKDVLNEFPFVKE